MLHVKIVRNFRVVFTGDTFVVMTRICIKLYCCELRLDLKLKYCFCEKVHKYYFSENNELVPLTLKPFILFIVVIIDIKFGRV